MILGGGGHHGGRWSDTISGKGLELHMKMTNQCQNNLKCSYSIVTKVSIASYCK